MKKNIFRRKRFWLLMVVCVFLWIYSVFTFLHFSDKNYVGILIELTETSIVVDDGKVGNTLIEYDEITKIFPKNTDKTLEIGIPVFVSTRKTETDGLRAEFIRFIDPAHFSKKK